MRKKSTRNWPFILIMVLLPVACIGLVYTMKDISPQDSTDYSEVPTYLKIADQGSLVSNKEACWKEYEAFADGYNRQHFPFSELRWTGDMTITCEDGWCICE